MEVAFANDKRQANPLIQMGKNLLNKIKCWKPSHSFYYFLVLIGVGIGFYFIMLAENGFTLAYGGDYSAQYIPMGYHVWDYYHEWIKTGHFTLFDQTIYLGVNSFGSNAYYGLFSPFNIIIVLFPRILVPQAMAICSIIKLACAGLFFSIYVSHAFKLKEAVSRICGLAYAFAGWGAFYLWYNNYQDVLVFFPLVLLGVEKVIKENKPWVLCLGVFLLSICNYVLMVPYIICGFIYAMFRFFQSIPNKTVVENFKTLGFGFIGFAGGLIMALFVFWPALMATLSSPKLDSYSYFGELKSLLLNGKVGDFFKLLLSWKVAPDQHGSKLQTRILYPIIEFFVPASTCRSLPSLRIQSWDFDDMAVSLWCYVPFIMFLVPALIQSAKERKWSHLIAFALLVFSLFTPFMYYLTMGFTNGYARWTLFIATSLIAYVGIYLNKIPNVARWHMHVGVAFALIGVVTSWILTIKLSSEDINKYGNYIYRFIAYIDGKPVFNFTNLFFIAELVYIVGVYFALLFTYNKKVFHILITCFVAFEAVIMGNLVTWGHGYDTNYNNGYALNERFRKIYSKIQKNDKSFYRLYTSIGDDYSINNGMMNNYGSGSFFHSLYNFEVDDFSVYVGMENSEKDVGGHYRGKNQYIDNLLGVKYYFISKNKSKYNDFEKHYPGHYTANVPFDFEKSNRYGVDSKDFVVYENPNMNDFGYTYDKIYDGTLNRRVATLSESVKNSIVLFSAPLVSQEDGKEINDKYDDITITSEEPSTSSFQMLTKAADYNYSFYDIYAATNTVAKAYDFEKITSIPSSFAKVDNYARKDENGQSKAQHYFAFYEPKTASSPLFKAGTSIYARAKFDGSIKYDFYFIDKDNNIVMYDSHDDDTTDNTCWMRSFYIREDIYRLAICGKYDESFFIEDGGTETINFFKESQEDYVARREAASHKLVENVKYSADKFTFTSNFESNRFVLSRVAFDKGWKITAKDKATGKAQSIKVYKGNGGFVSFVAPKGNYSYTMTYETPYLAISYLVSALATTSFFVSLVGYQIYQNKKRQHYLDGIYREN